MEMIWMLRLAYLWDLAKPKLFLRLRTLDKFLSRQVLISPQCHTSWSFDLIVMILMQIQSRRKHNLRNLRKRRKVVMKSKMDFQLIKDPNWKDDDSSEKNIICTMKMRSTIKMVSLSLNPHTKYSIKFSSSDISKLKSFDHLMKNISSRIYQLIKIPLYQNISITFFPHLKI